MMRRGPMKSRGAILACVAAAICAAAQPARAAGTEFMEYDVTWVGLSVGAMTIRSETNGAGRTTRSLHLWNRPWVALVYPVDSTVECTIEPTPEGPRHVVVKKVAEKNFFQDDTLVLYPDQGLAIWSNALAKTSYRSAVPKGSRDLVSFFFDLRDVLASGPMQVGGDYRLVMDGAIHELEIKAGEPRTIRTPQGRLKAIPVQAKSKSPTLFSRNRPESVWISTGTPAVISADVASRFGPVRLKLVRWERDGAPVDWGAAEVPTPENR